MSSENSTEKNSFTTKSELGLKLATGVLGVLYVLGLLVSNLHLMTLGISDFTSLQARNVMTGFLFVFYSSLVLLAVTPISTAIYFCGRIVISSKLRPVGKFVGLVGATFVALLLLALIINIIGIISGYMFPWGRPWELGYEMNPWGGGMWSNL